MKVVVCVKQVPVVTEIKIDPKTKFWFERKSPYVGIKNSQKEKYRKKKNKTGGAE